MKILYPMYLWGYYYYQLIKHHHPYKLGSIKKWVKLMVNEIYKVSFSIGKHFQDKITCDVVEMSATHLSHSRPWQYDIDVIYKKRDNIYLFS